jgi:hypothetical protein
MKITTVNTKNVGTTIQTNFDCQIENSELFNEFYTHGLKELKFYSTNLSFELTPKENAKILLYGKCTFEALGVNKISYSPVTMQSQETNSNSIAFDQNGEEGNCFGITSRYDKFEEDTTYSSPILKQITLYKKRRAAVVIYFMRLSCQGYTVNVLEQGVTILLENDLRIEKPDAEINVDANSTGYEYSAFVQLTEEEMKLIAQNQMTDFRLYIYDAIVNVLDRNKYMKYANCLLYNY